MSSWDRSRSIPWSRVIPVAPPPTATAESAKENVDLMRERIWRDLAREAAREEKELESGAASMAVASLNGDGDGNSISSGDSSSSGMTSLAPLSESQAASLAQKQQQQQTETNFLGYIGRPYQTSDLLRNLAFGATIGSITGMCFGFMDSIRSAQSSPLLKSASRDAQGKFIFQGTYRSGFFYGGFFGIFHTIKYGVRTVIDPGDVGEIGVASVLTLGGMFAKREWRASLPYAVMLVGMDGFHIFMREEGKA
ncbi:hypothetical protein ACHAWU_003782 [Discostella pseudostelligera]|uniref:Mitochondrial import inner membrane translocase subunit TIM22 n=1 Tax=Discostella pseudostelligera TaxID=259834 RepID=A0ABD3MMP4_9STRA